MTPRAATVVRTALAVVGVLAVVALAGLWLAGGYRVVSVPTDSMVPTVSPGDRVVVRGADRVSAGDIVVADLPAWTVGEPIHLVLKRVVAVGGQTVVCCDATGRVTVDGVPLAGPVGEPSALTSTGPRRMPNSPFEVTVPPGRLFLMGDNRTVSVDSRAHLDADGGTVPTSAVVGVAAFRLFPPGGLPALT